MSGARQGRRRRLLQDEVISASRELAAYQPDDKDEEQDSQRGEGRRYALPAGSLGLALAKQHFPAHIMVSVGVVMASIAVVAALTAMDVYRDSLSRAVGISLDSLVVATQPTSLANWTTVSAMLVAATFATMIWIVRMHRVDDYRGRHRLWRGVIGMALVLSVDAATNMHQTLASAMHQVTGWQLMANNQGWWLAFGSLMVGWVAFRIFSDIKESRFATIVFAASLVAGLVSISIPLFGLGGTHRALAAVAARTLCYLLATSAAVIYMRFLRNDVVAGVVSKPHLAKLPETKPTEERQEKAKSKRTPKSTPANDAKTVEKPEPAKVAKKAPQKAKQPKPEPVAEVADDSRWTDGSDGYSENYDDSRGNRKLSKSERKRLRKQKAARRAA